MAIRRAGALLPEMVQMDHATSTRFVEAAGRVRLAAEALRDMVGLFPLLDCDIAASVNLGCSGRCSVLESSGPGGTHAAQCLHSYGLRTERCPLGVPIVSRQLRKLPGHFEPRTWPGLCGPLPDGKYGPLSVDSLV
eukprot:4699830-Amphidinium_carterae.1